MSGHTQTSGRTHVTSVGRPLGGKIILGITGKNMICHFLFQYSLSKLLQTNTNGHELTIRIAGGRGGGGQTRGGGAMYVISHKRNICMF